MQWLCTHVTLSGVGFLIGMLLVIIIYNSTVLSPWHLSKDRLACSPKSTSLVSGQYWQPSWEFECRGCLKSMLRQLLGLGTSSSIQMHCQGRGEPTVEMFWGGSYYWLLIVPFRSLCQPYSEAAVQPPCTTLKCATLSSNSWSTPWTPW